MVCFCLKINIMISSYFAVLFYSCRLGTGFGAIAPEVTKLWISLSEIAPILLGDGHPELASVAGATLSVNTVLTLCSLQWMLLYWWKSTTVCWLWNKKYDSFCWQKNVIESCVLISVKYHEFNVSFMLISCIYDLSNVFFHSMLTSLWYCLSYRLSLVFMAVRDWHFGLSTAFVVDYVHILFNFSTSCKCFFAYFRTQVV